MDGKEKNPQSWVFTYIFAASLSIDVWIPSLKFHVLHTKCKANVDITLHQRMKQARNGSSIDWQARIDFFFWQWDSREPQSGQFVAETWFTHLHTHQCFSTLMVFRFSSSSMKVIGLISAWKYWPVLTRLVDWHWEPLRGASERHKYRKVLINMTLIWNVWIDS